MKQLKYNLAILLQITFIILPVLSFAAWSILESTIFLIAGGVLAVVAVALYKPLDNLRIKARNQAEYDEFGRSKKKSYNKLSKKEREQIDLQKTADMERVMSSSELKKKIHKGPANPQKEMDDLVGLVPVKQKMREMVARMEFEAQEENKTGEGSMSGRHMVFYGAPGTGKTTVARILTGFLYQYGYIKKNKCVEVDGNFLKAGMDTALKTELIIQQAYDGVLFIDEAYSLQDDPYAGKQAIATLLKQMEDHRDRFILILAGYTDEMKTLLSANPGFSSRIKEYLNFPDYNASEMNEIFIKMAGEQGYVVGADAMDAFGERIARERKRRTFGNARTARNVLDESIDKHAFNFFNHNLEPNDKYRLRGIDVSRTLKNNSF